ncbi:MAG TPA: Xaa-Pro peptidase family protein [Acetobacteraceae bacterium]|nr:Xaa-Pro peptidase family protein [Acetobacteraceae bacterium]
MALHFTRGEFAERRRRAEAALEARGLAGLLIFQQESMYYLTGYDTFGFCFFQCLYLGLDGRLALITRSADLRQAQRTSIIDDIRIWTDEEGADPAQQLRAMLADLGAGGLRLGIETASYGLTHANGRKVDAALAGFCTLEPADGLIDRLRVVKSDAELAYVRRAGALADAALEAGLAEIRPGADEGRVLAAMQGAIFAGGGDYPANEFIIGSGEDALLCRYHSGRRTLGENDQLTLEFAGVFRHYHAALMRTVVIGQGRPEHARMHEACAEALAACEAMLRPGHRAGDVFDAHARVMDAHGMKAARLNACGYSLGAKFTPSWMDPPMFYRGNSEPLVPGMVMFLHVILMDSGSGTAMTLGRTYITTASSPEPLSRAPLALIER